MSELEAVLAEAARTGEVVEVIYYGGSQPGTRRDLLPLHLDPPYVQARCLEMNEFKTFRLDRMELAVGDVASVPRYRPGVVPAAPADEWQLASLAKKLRSMLSPTEWSIDLAPDSVSVYGRFKNGNWRRSPQFSIERVGEGYTFRGRGMPGRHYKSLDRAVAALAGKVGLGGLAPTPQKRSRSKLVMPARDPDLAGPPMSRPDRLEFTPPGISPAQPLSEAPRPPEPASADTLAGTVVQVSAEEARAAGLTGWKAGLYRVFYVLGVVAFVGFAIRLVVAAVRAL